MLGSKRDMLRLDPELLKVLASDRRRDILHLLKARRMTVTELSKRMELGKPTVLDHLKRLQEAELIQRHEDERLWVYYSLTEMGRSFVQPSKIPVFLMLGAVILALAAALTFMALSDDGSSDAPPEQLAVSLEPMPAGTYALYPGAGGSLLLDVQGASGAPTDLAVGLTKDGPVVSRTPMIETALFVEQDVSGLRAEAPSDIRPGTYHLYVADAAGRDNRESMPEVVVPRIDVAGAPSSWWRGLDEDTALTVRADQTPIEGTLLLMSAADTFEIPVAGGHAILPAPALDAASAGVHRMVYVPPDSSLQVPVQRITVHDPVIEVVPRVVTAPDAVFLVQVRSQDVLGEAPDNIPITIAGVAAAPEAQGQGTFRVQASLTTGNTSLQVGRLHATAIQVVPDISMRFERLAGPELRIRIDGAAGPIPGAKLLLDEESLGMTDDAGLVDVPWPEPGTRRVAVQVAGAPQVSRLVDVGASRVSARDTPVLALGIGQVEESAQGVTLTVAVTNPGAEPEEATVAATQGTTLVSVGRVHVPSNATVRLTLAGVPGDGGSLSVQAFRPPEIPVTFTDRTTSGGATTTTATTTTTGTYSITSGTTGPGSGSFDTALLGVPASEPTSVTTLPTGPVGSRDEFGTGQSTPMLGTGALLLLFAALAGRKR